MRCLVCVRIYHRENHEKIPFGILGAGGILCQNAAMARSMHEEKSEKPLLTNLYMYTKRSANSANRFVRFSKTRREQTGDNGPTITI